MTYMLPAMRWMPIPFWQSVKFQLCFVLYLGNLWSTYRNSIVSCLPQIKNIFFALVGLLILQLTINNDINVIVLTC